DQDSGDVRVIDTATLQVTGQPIKVGDAPAEIAMSPDGSRVYAANMYSNDVSMIDTRTLQVTASLGKVGAGPRGIAVASITRTASVTYQPR
ncbi:MAG: YncE family protein, partial [bacterium]